MKQFLVSFVVGVIVWVLIYAFIGDPQDIYGGYFLSKNYQEILCEPSADGNIYWNVQASYNPEMRFRLQFLQNGTLNGKIYSWNMIPEQEISGLWQIVDNNIVLTYSYNIANTNIYGQVVNWMPSTQNCTLSITRCDQNFISAVSAGNDSNYSWIFSR